MTIVGLKRAALVAMLGGSLAACGGSGSDNSSPFTKQVNGGIWHGTDTLTNQAMSGIVAEDGDFRFWLEDGTVYTGKVAVDHTVIDATYDAFTATGNPYDDGTSNGKGTIHGIINALNSMTFDVVFQTGGYPALTNSYRATGTDTVTYDKLYDRPSSLPTVSGNFKLDAAGTILSIASNGVVFAQVSGDAQCIVNGNVTMKDAVHNAYGITLMYTGCTGANASLNNVQLSGLVSLDNTRSPERLVGVVDSESTASPVALVFAMDRT